MDVLIFVQQYILFNIILGVGIIGFGKIDMDNCEPSIMIKHMILGLFASSYLLVKYMKIRNEDKKFINIMKKNNMEELPYYEE